MGTGMSKVVDGLYLGNIRDSEDGESLTKNGITHILSVHNNARAVLEDMTYLCISASDSSTQNLLAGVSRSTTVLVAYLMTVTDLSWEECLAATKVVRSYVSPNFGFQQQLQEYERTLLKEYRSWVRQEYGKNPFNDQEELRRLLTEQEEKQREQQLGSRENRWLNSPPPTYPLPYHAYGTSHNRWSNR
ncbi:dual specificity protein phosphatase 22-A-like isoform X4 [Pelodiscus sinensis]|uniref:dual specificity protein phosphatase 22-A-like isoform X4 n=1 Tax=Pelodiscus sinensis TaxID=13735 RepID=UPI003F6BE0B1